MRGPALALFALLMDTGAATADWLPSCKTDAMDDVMSCQVVNRDAKVMVIFKGKNHNIIGICAYMNDFPGREAQLRVDKNKAVTTEDNGCVSAERILDQMRKGNMLRSRYYEWPDDYAKDGSASLDGFSAVIDAIKAGRHDQ